jgi:hypothetical protein
MSEWEQLLATALVGTDRRGGPHDVLDGRVVLDEHEPDRQVLRAAAMLGTYRDAGRRAIVATELVTPAPAETLPRASETAVSVLELLLAGEADGIAVDIPLVDEWLHACAHAHQRVPHRLVPELLELATRDRSRRDDVHAVVGARGPWLATFNPRWAWARHDVTQTDVDLTTATRDERRAIVSQLRTVDPDAARDAITPIYATLPAEQRAEVIDLLAINLSMTDEPFLEAALDDKSKSVRATAVQRLDHLAASRRAHRAADRLADLVHVRKNKLVVDDPPPPDDAATRDGFAARTKADYLENLVGAAPLDWWPRHTGLDVETLAQQAKTEAELRAGWVHAAIAQHDSDWAAALYDAQAHTPLLAAMTPSAAARVAREAMRTKKTTIAHLRAILDAVPPPWPESLVEATLQRAQQDRNGTVLAPVLGEHLRPEHVERVQQWIEQLPDDDTARRVVRALHHTLTLRQTIYLEFAKT